MQRRDAILQCAREQFARFGFRGASLRDIARDAGVSLTLLNHHFGCKAALLSAAVANHAPMLRERAEALNRLHRGGAGSFTPLDVVQAWIGSGFERAALPDGLSFLRLLARVIDDPAEDGVTALRQELDDAALAFIEALLDCYPQASHHAAAAAWVCVNASVSRMLTRDGRVEQIGAAGAVQHPEVDQAWLERFLVAALHASFSVPQSRANLVGEEVPVPPPDGAPRRHTVSDLEGADS